MTGALDSMTFNPILQEGSVPADRGALWTRTTTSQQLAKLRIPNTALILQRVGGEGLPDSFMPFGPSTSLGSDVGKFERYYLVDLRDHMLVWELDLDTGDVDGGVSVLAVVTVSDPVLVATSGVRDARGSTASAVQDVVNATLKGVPVVNLPDAVPTLQRALLQHRFDCGLSVRWAHVTIDPSPLVSQHLRKMAELKNDHALALQRMELDKERIAVEAELEQDQETLDELRRHTERVKSEAETEAKRIVELANREASLLKRKAAEDATQVRGDAERKAKEVIDSAMQEAERIERDAQDAAGQRNLERVREESQRQLEAAERLNNEIANRPEKLMGYLLAMSDTTAVREAIKIVEEREHATWDRLKELEKLKLMSQEDLRDLVVAVLNDPAGGAFGVAITPPPSHGPSAAA